MGSELVRIRRVNRGNKPVENRPEIAENTPETQEKPKLKRRIRNEDRVKAERYDLPVSY